MKRIKAKLLEISDKIHADDMEYMTYSRNEFIKELDKNITSLSAAKDYLKAMNDECDRLIDEMEVSSWLSIKEEIRQCLYTIWEYALKDTIWEDALKEEKEKFWEKKMEQISIGDIYYNYINKDRSVSFYKVVGKSRKTIKCQGLETNTTKRSSKSAKPGEPIEGRFYIMKNETIHGEWCCPYTKSEPVSFYLSKN